MRLLLTAMLGTFVAIAGADAAEPKLPCPSGTRLVQQAREARCETPDGVAEGPFTVRNADGTLRYAGTARRGKTHGAWTSWSAAGKVSVEAHYEDGELVGPFRRFGANGILQIEGSHDRAGEMDGIWNGYWPNGRLRTQWSMSHGEQQGPVTTWYESGAKKSKGRRAGGQPDGAWTYFAEDGLVTHRCRYDRGRVAEGPCGQAGPE